MAKQVDDRQAATEYVAQAAETHATRVGEAFRARFGQHHGKRDKGEVPDLGAALLLVARAMRDANGALVTASDAHDKELADDAAPREARDEAAAALVEQIVGIRGAVENVYGDAGLKVLGIYDPAPKDPQAIAAYSRKLATQLTDAKVKWPKPQRKGFHFDAKVWADDLDTEVAKLDTALKDVARETHEAKVTGDAKAKAMAENDEAFSRCADFVSAALRLIGDDALAAKVRPSTRRPGTTLQAPEPTDTPAPGAPSSPAKT